MQAIITKVIPSTLTKPTRIKATCARGSMTLSHWPDNLAVSDAAAHLHVANMLCAQFITEDADSYGTPPGSNPWGRRLVTGCLPSGDFAHVFVD